MRHVTLTSGLLVVLFTTSVIRADTITTITSGDFSLGYGYTGDSYTGVGSWTTAETADYNISPAGDFTFTAAPTSSKMSSAGPSFAGRALTDAGGYSAWVNNFSVAIAGGYTGAAPTDASTTNPNYQLTLEISGIQMYVGGIETPSAQWREITPDHSGATSMLTSIAQYTDPPGVAGASIYTNLAWKPTDVSNALTSYAVGLTAPNDSFTRTFQIAPSSTSGASYYGDGFEVFGRVSLSYNAVPEPATVVMLMTGLVGLLCYAWRKRK